MNVIQGGGTLRTADAEEKEQATRCQALHYAVEWARSAGPEHATRVSPDEFVAAAKAFYGFLKGRK